MKRARAAKVHACIISHLKKEMPAMMGKAKAQQKLIDNLEEEFLKVSFPLVNFLGTFQLSFFMSHLLMVIDVWYLINCGCSFCFLNYISTLPI